MPLTTAMPIPMQDLSYGDYGMLLAIILGSSYVVNRGHFLPKRADPFHHLLFEKPQQQDGSASSSSHTRDIGEKTRELGARFVILWGSQSGTAESIANRLARDIHQRLKVAALVGDLSDYSPSTLSNIPDSTMVVLVMSTYGEGDPSDNAQEFVSFITNSPNDSLSHVKFAAFGCGNSTYRYFNKVINDTASGMERYGAKLLLPVGAGDEATRSTHEDSLEWKERLFSLLVSEHGLSDHQAEYEPSVKIATEEPSGDLPKDSFQKQLAQLPITSRETVATYEGQDRTCVSIKVDISEYPEIKYRTGDHIAIWPSNAADEVDRLLRVLGRESQRNDGLRITPTDEVTEVKVPSSTTLLALFSQYLDICAPVSRETVLALAQMTASTKVKNELQRIGKSRQTYADFLEHNYLTLVRLMELMNAFDPSNSWTSLSLPFVIDFLPAMQPRLYSISSSSIVEPRQVGLVVAVKPGTVLKRPDTVFHGVASTYLSKSPVSDIKSDTLLVRAEIRRSTFKLPFNSQTPVIMVAAGTGIAPFRAFIQERSRLASIGRAIGPMVLFFGSQNQSDNLFSDDLETIAANHASNKLKIVNAFSRPAGGASQKSYVQDKVFEHRREVLEHMLDGDGALYICGATTMAKAVGNVILEAVSQKKQCSAEEASSWRQERRKSSRWHEDVWS